MTMNKYLSIITLNLKKLNTSIKRQRVVECIEKHDPHICCLEETHLRNKRQTPAESEVMEKIFYANGDKKKLWYQYLYLSK